MIGFAWGGEPVTRMLIGKVVLASNRRLDHPTSRSSQCVKLRRDRKNRLSAATCGSRGSSACPNRPESISQERLSGFRAGRSAGARRRLARVDPRAAAEQVVLFRLAEIGCDAELTSNRYADVVACSREGTRVALLRICVRGGDGWSMRTLDAQGDARNRAHVFVDFGATAEVVTCFVVPSAIVAAERRASRGWPGKGASALEAYREAWHLLALSRQGSSRSSPVVSPSSPSL